MSLRLPEIEKGLERLGQSTETLPDVLENYIPAREFAGEIARKARSRSAKSEIERIRDQVENTFGNQRMGALMSDFVLDRDRQMQTLSGLGKDAILSIMSQGVLPAAIARSFKVSYDTFAYFMEQTCSPDEIKTAKAHSADSMVAEAFENLKQSADKDDLALHKTVMETALKLARTMNKSYIEQRPSTAIQVNQYGEPAEAQQGIPYLQIVAVDKDTLEPLPEHRHTADVATKFEPEGVVDGEFTIFQGN